MTTPYDLMLPPSPLLDGAFDILSDGKARSTDEILAEGLQRGLLPPDTTRKYLYTALSQYIQRTLGRGRKPQILEDIERRFRLNQPVDRWPVLDTTGLPSLGTSRAMTADEQRIIAALQEKVKGPDPTAFEQAVCDAVGLLGFAVTHLGGGGAPDGQADALLGPLSYRVMLECKLAHGDTISHSSAVAEAAKYKEPFHADACALIAPSYDGEALFLSELREHNVSAWTPDDLIRCIILGLNALQVRGLFCKPALVSDELADIAWEQVHGRPQRLRTIVSILLTGGLQQQQDAYTLGDARNAPLLTVDVGVAMVDSRLVGTGATLGCSREDVQAAFTWLTHPLVNKAAWADARDEAIVIL